MPFFRTKASKLCRRDMRACTIDSNFSPMRSLKARTKSISGVAAAFVHSRIFFFSRLSLQPTSAPTKCKTNSLMPTLQVFVSDNPQPHRFHVLPWIPPTKLHIAQEHYDSFQGERLKALCTTFASPAEATPHSTCFLARSRRGARLCAAAPLDHSNARNIDKAS